MSYYSFKSIIEFIHVHARMKMRAQANKLFLSYLWWIIEPVLLVSLFYIVFEYLLQRGGEDFVVFLLVGKVVFMWFQKAAMMGSYSLVQNKGIIVVRDIPKWMFPVINVQIATYKSLVAIILVIIGLWVSGYSNPLFWWQLFPLFCVSYFLISGVACFLSLLVALAEDFSQIIALIMMGLMFASGVFWDVNTLLNERAAAIIFQFNPLAGLIDAYRAILMRNEIINVSNLLPSMVSGCLLWVISLLIFKYRNNQITRALVSK